MKRFLTLTALLTILYPAAGKEEPEVSMEEEIETFTEEIYQLEIMRSEVITRAVEWKLTVEKTTVKPYETSPPPKTKEEVVATPTQEKQQPYRRIQFVATSAGKDFSRFAHLGEVVTEQVPGRNIQRYMIAGNFSDAKVKEIIQELARGGYSGAFEK